MPPGAETAPKCFRGRAETVRTVVITTCTNRKRQEPAERLCARTLARGEPAEVAQRWFARLSASDDPHIPARDLYCGRSFREAERAAAAVDGDLFVISAGLGLISASTKSPAYNLTISTASPDCVLPLIGGDAATWWAQVSTRSSFATEFVDQEGLILAALPRPYLEMVAKDWARWPAGRLARLRLFCKELPDNLPGGLRRTWMPYDDRLDQVGRGRAGTQADFAQRALRHFADHIAAAGEGAAGHARLVAEALAGHQAPERPDRERMTDRALVDLITREWDAVGGRSGAMLARLRRELNVACEQSRFKDLFKQAAAVRQGKLL